MKKLFLLAISAIIFACTNNSKPGESSSKDSLDATSANPETPAKDTTAFDIRKLPISDKELGEFPFIQPPTNYCFGFCSSWDGKIRNEDVKKVDIQYFAVNGKLTPIKGKSYSNTINSKQKFQSLEVEKAFNQMITDLGGLIVNNVEVPSSEIKRVGDTELITNKHGESLDYNLLDRVKTFIIRTKEKIVWVQFSLMDGESGKITILEQKAK